MPITSLRIENFRNVTTAELAPCVGFNIIFGGNGSGKTSILEALHYLSVGRFFRATTATHLIQHHAPKFALCAQLLNDFGHQIPIGIERDRQGSQKSRLATRDLQNNSELAAVLPLRLINSHSHQLFESGPLFRRKYLDWGLFYYEPSFTSVWRQFERILKQRNSSLREKRPKSELDNWTTQLIKSALQLDRLRREYVVALLPFIEEVTEFLLPLKKLQLHYYPGWEPNAEEDNYSALLSEVYFEELRAGYTLYGPHRADFDITIAEVSAKHFLSRGQQKLLICAMILAQGMLLAQRANKQPIYLVDDLPAELDAQSSEKLIDFLSKQQTQIFITAIESQTIAQHIESSVPATALKVFHVEHGQVSEKATEHLPIDADVAIRESKANKIFLGVKSEHEYC